MIGLILCAGKGTRLGDEVKDKPKCMVDVGDKPILERVANYLEKQGVRRIVVNLHSYPSKVMEYFGQRFLYLYEPVPMGEFATVQIIKGWFPDEEIMVVNGDTLITKKEKVRHNGVTIYDSYKGNRKIIDKDFIDCGTPEGLKKARKYVTN
jgi:NDP-sugar pyrophosphorylase family protein